MSHIRWAGIPIDHLVAEIAAFPLASEAALRLGITELTPWLIPERGLPTAHLWRAAEQSLAGHAPNVSLDELTAMRDRTWFRPESVDELRAQPLHNYLRLLAGRHLRVRGATAVPCLQLEDRKSVV